MEITPCLHRLSRTRIVFDPRASPSLQPPWPMFQPIRTEDFLSKFDFVAIPGDGKCLFRALALGYYRNGKHWSKLKQRLVDHATGMVARTGKIADTDAGVLRDAADFFNILQRTMPGVRRNILSVSWIAFRHRFMCGMNLSLPTGLLRSWRNLCPLGGPVTTTVSPRDRMKTIHVGLPTRLYTCITMGTTTTIYLPRI